ncbi:PREDICTED: cation/H(+) antiporter 15-like [Nelumbo nucifera]|uniref:Cation/H(+) antiporter 15-like n=2 Tax=Nelumbo nucifera TaxID=4432 RepID=A0A822ZGV8_NELNU|nr:PREDICTED: cation/H(+) antiporter 15-like [Nelumbo nucifera]DAD42655.1 TPA_asm: hypothetical protein HUJ06_000885 [Nelumbo nucifera]
MSGLDSNSADGLSLNFTGEPIVCYSPTMITAGGIWEGDNPLDYSLPLFTLQLGLIVIITRILVFILKPFRQPRVVSEILGGVILGPSVLGRSKTFTEIVFPLRSITLIETMANVGLLYYLFLVGVEMDLTMIKRTKKKAFSIAIAGMFLPFAIGIIFMSFTSQNTGVSHSTSSIFYLAVALSVTAFPVVARILAELKLLNTELGKIAMSAALVNDMCAWILLAVAVALSGNDSNNMAPLGMVFTTIGYVGFCIFVVRPAIEWIVERTPEGENFSDFHICLILTGVMVFGFINDAVGTHSIFGAFFFGLVIPNGHLGVVLIEKLEDFVSGLLLPLFFAVNGLRTDVGAIQGFGSWSTLILLAVLACLGKVFGTLFVSFLYKMPMREGVSLGLLMNTKGLIEIIILNIGREHGVLDEQSFSVMVIAAIVMTSLITPIVTTIYKPTRRFLPYKRRTIQMSKPESELRILSCIHSPRNVPTIISLIDAAHPSKKSPICVYALHLVELTGRASAMLIVHNTRKFGHPALNRTQAQSDHIVNAFENYRQHTSGIAIQPLTAISPYSTMHEDICNLAEDKRVTFIILPFHKQQTVDGGMEATNPAFRSVNQNVLANAPCSVGILVDRGFTRSARVGSNHDTHHVAMLFFGGPDDREALAYAWRMTTHPNVKLSLLRFLPGNDTSEIIVAAGNETEDSSILTVVTDNDKEKQLDEEYINEFRLRTVHNESVTYREKIVKNGEETVAAIRSIDNIHDLYIVGRSHGVVSPLTAGLTDWSECPELGAIGDLLASSDFAATVSVLVVQQYAGTGNHADGMGTTDSAAQLQQNDQDKAGNAGGGTFQNQPLAMEV